VLAACATGLPPARAPVPTPPDDAALLAQLEAPRLDLASVKVQPEGLTVEENWFLDLYVLFHSRNYGAFRVVFEAVDGREARAHLLIPPGDGPHPAIVVFPILAGSHVTAELLAKMMVRQGFAVAWLERRALQLETASSLDELIEKMRLSTLDARQLLDWLEQHPRIDPGRLFSGGVSLGSMQAATLAAVDPRVRGALLLLAAGGLAEILYDSDEIPVGMFRERILAQLGHPDREGFLATVKSKTRVVDPLTWAHRIDPRSVYMVTGRFDRVLRPVHARALWEALGQPRWRKLPSGHYQALPFMFSAVAAGARHLHGVGR
jgi:cephalosporin-C deacetylase-like acetyl esterase